jgi:hypothetical protein
MNSPSCLDISKRRLFFESIKLIKENDISFIFKSRLFCWSFVKLRDVIMVPICQECNLGFSWINLLHIQIYMSEAWLINLSVSLTLIGHPFYTIKAFFSKCRVHLNEKDKLCNEIWPPVLQIMKLPGNH